MTIDEFHDSMRQQANVGQAQYFPPENLDIMINNAILNKYTIDYKHFEATQEITDTLGFYKTVSEPLALVAGKVSLPPNCFHLTGVEIILADDTRVEGETLTDGEFLGRKGSKAFAPSNEFPIARQLAKTLEVLPADAKSVVVYYLRSPAKAKYGYVPNAEGTGWAFSAAGSVEVDYPEPSHTEIQKEALFYMGGALNRKLNDG